jgi:hypothetical protein
LTGGWIVFAFAAVSETSWQAAQSSAVGALSSAALSPECGLWHVVQEPSTNGLCGLPAFRAVMKSSWHVAQSLSSGAFRSFASPLPCGSWQAAH